MISNKNIPGEIKDFGILVFSGDVLLFYFRFVLPRGITGGEARKIHILQNFFKGKDRLVFRQATFEEIKVNFLLSYDGEGHLIPGTSQIQ